MNTKFTISKEGANWVLQIPAPGGTQVYRCSTEEQARHLGSVFSGKPTTHGATPARR